MKKETVWYRGIRPGAVYADAHWSERREVAEEFAAPAKVGGKRGKVVTMREKDMGKKLYKTVDKETLAKEIDITAKPYSLEFDSQAKEILQAKGFEGVHYSNGTFDVGELHIFTPKPKTSHKGQVSGGNSNAKRISKRPSRVTPKTPRLKY